MTVESATYINQLDATKPGATDPKSEGDDHLRLLKSTVKATFPNVTGAVSATHTELGYVAGVTSALQTQLNAKAPSASPTFTGTVALPSTTSIGSVSSTELGYVAGATSALQTQLNAKAPIDSPTFTGTPSAPTAAAGTSTTQVATTAYVATSYAPLASPALTGTPTAPTATAGTNTTQLATTAFVQSTAFNAALPSQTGNAGKYVTTNGTTASWAAVVAASLQEFSSSGTWTKPSSATFVMVEAWGAGGGGGSGRRGAAASVRGGGAGGGGGAYAFRLFKASDLPSTISVTIGAGGAGGAARTADSTDGASGSAGGNTTFGLYLTAFGGSGGVFGQASSSSATKGGGVLSSTGDPNVGLPTGQTVAGHFGSGQASGTGVATASGFGGGMGGGFDGTSTTYAGGCSYQGGPGGGAGGAIDSGNTVRFGGFGGAITGTSGNGAGAGGIGFNGFPGIGRQGGGGGGANSTGLSTAGIYDAAYGDGRLVATTDGNAVVITSTDNGTTWTFAAVPGPQGAINKVLYVNSAWYVYSDAAGATVYTSTNFSTWSIAGYLPSSGRYLNYANGVWLVGGDSGYLATSTDLTTWTARTSGTIGTIVYVIWTGTNYVATAQSSGVIYSSNLISWSNATGLGGVSIVYDIAANGSTVVISTTTTPFTYISTNNGQSFVGTSSTTANASNTYPSLRYLGGYFILATGASSLYTSTDGNTWTLQTDGTTDAYSGLAYTGTTWFVGSNINNTFAGITSTNITAWTQRSITAIAVGAGGAGGAGGTFGGGGGGGAGSLNGNNSGAGGTGGNGLVRVYAW